MKVRLRDRGIISLVGFGTYWASGYVASILYLTPDRPSIACTDTATRTCTTAFALIIIAAVGFWTAIIAGMAFVVGVVQRQLRIPQRRVTLFEIAGEA